MGAKMTHCKVCIIFVLQIHNGHEETIYKQQGDFGKFKL